MPNLDRRTYSPPTERSAKSENASINNLTALVLCGGHGTRLGSTVGDRPKSLMDVGGMKLIDHSISPLLQAGVSDFVFAVGPVKYRSDMIREYVPKQRYGASSKISSEHSGGSSAAIRATIKEFDITGHTAIMSADTVAMGLDFEDAYRFHLANNANLTLIGSRAEKTESRSDVNLINAEGSTKTVFLAPALEDIVEDPIIFSDIAICSPKVTEFIKNSNGDLASFWENLIVQLSMLGEVHTYIAPKELKHVNVNFPEDLDRVEQYVRETK